MTLGSSTHIPDTSKFFIWGVVMKLVIGLILAVGVGIACRWFGIPLPGPPALMGAAMAVAMASGYTATDHWLARRSGASNAAIQATVAACIEATRKQ